MKFKIGDIISVKGEQYCGNYASSEATITKIIAGYCEAEDGIWYQQKGRSENVTRASACTLISTKKTTMEKITVAFKKFISADLQNAVKAGFRNGGLELTDKGVVIAIEALLAATPAAQAEFDKASADAVAEMEKAK